MTAKASYILGINYLTNGSCALMREGEIVYVGQEERFNRFKNVSGFPHQALAYGFKKLGIEGSDIEKVGIATNRFDPLIVKASLIQNLSIRDLHDYYGKRFWRKVFAGEDCSDYYRWMRDAEQFNKHPMDFDYSFITDDLLSDPEKRIDAYRNQLKLHLKSHFGIDEQKITFLDHHVCHASYGYFGSFFREKPCAIVTWDGIGDKRNQTVFLAKNDVLEQKASSFENDIGRVYKFATLLLNMRPEEHEYKVMGMAPYSKASYVDKAYAPLAELTKIDNMAMRYNKRPQDLFAHLKEAWFDQRFDNICGATQRYAETLAVDLFRDIYNHLKVRRFVVSGGVALNIKMNKVLSELDFVDEFYVAGSGGDESLCMGACYVLNAPKGNNQPVEHMYLGHDVADDLADGSWKKLCEGFTVRDHVNEAEVARMLANGEVVARIDGRAEFGARALGNRSILANPRDFDVVQRINEAIKKRDFWMPFALSVLEEDQDYCVKNPKRLKAPCMSIGFDTNEANYNNFRAGTHPYDRTVRPQFVNQKHSPSYHKLISSFKAITGVPAILNTSLNLHGEPIVNTAADALRTFSQSGLDHLYIGSTLVSKKPEKSTDAAERKRKAVHRQEEPIHV